MEEVCVPVETAKRRSSSTSKMLSGLLIGGIIGVGAALLSAPYSGEETRERLKDKSMEIKDKVVTNVQDTSERVKDLAQRGNERVEDMRTRGQGLLQEQKTNLESAVEGIKTGVRTYREEGGLPDLSSLKTPTQGTGLSEDVMNTDITGPDVEEGAV